MDKSAHAFLVICQKIIAMRHVETYNPVRYDATRH
jgi:hypothetical protein